MKRGIPLAAVLDLALSGCATLISGRTQIITVDLVNANGATCRGVDQVGQKYVWEKTPSSTEVIKGDGPLILTCEREGFKKRCTTSRSDSPQRTRRASFSRLPY